MTDEVRRAPLPEVLDEFEVIQGLDDNYTRLHEAIRIKNRYGLAPWLDAWATLDRKTRLAFLESLTVEELAQIAPFLCERIVGNELPGDRDLLVAHVTRLSGVVAFVPALIGVYSHLSVNLQRDVEWFLLNTGTGEALRFLAHILEEATRQGRRPPAVATAMKTTAFVESHIDDIRRLATRFQSYYVPVDEWSIRGWLKQFGGEDDQARMLAVLERVKFFDSAAILASCEKLWSRVSEEDRNQAWLVGLGPSRKSGNHILYEFRPKGFDTRRISDLSTVLRLPGSDMRVIVFLDDMIGSGKQAQDFVNDILEQKPGSVRLNGDELNNLQRAKKYYLAVAGFTKGCKRIRDAGVFDDVIVAAELTDRDRAFAPDSGIFADARDLRAAEQAAALIGSYLYPEVLELGDDGPGPLGFGKCAALIVFHYNTPNNSLPILWKAGRVRTRDWVPLFPRRE